MSNRIDYLEKPFLAIEVYIFPVDIDGWGSSESELVSERHVFFDFRHIISFFHARLEFSGIESYLLCNILSLIRADRVSFFPFFQSIHFLGEFLVFVLRCGTEYCECVIRGILVYTERIHAVFQADFTRFRVFFEKLTANNLFEPYASGTLKVGKYGHLNLRVLIAKKRTFDFFIEESGRILCHNVRAGGTGSEKESG